MSDSAALTPTLSRRERESDRCAGEIPRTRSVGWVERSEAQQQPYFFSRVTFSYHSEWCFLAQARLTQPVIIAVTEPLIQIPA